MVAHALYVASDSAWCEQPLINSRKNYASFAEMTDWPDDVAKTSEQIRLKQFLKLLFTSKELCLQLG